MRMVCSDDMHVFDNKDTLVCRCGETRRIETPKPNVLDRQVVGQDCPTCSGGDVCNDPDCTKTHCEKCVEFRKVAL